MDLEAIRARDSAKADLYHEAEIDRRELLKALDECRAAAQTTIAGNIASGVAKASGAAKKAAKPKK